MYLPGAPGLSQLVILLKGYSLGILAVLELPVSSGHFVGAGVRIPKPLFWPPPDDWILNSCLS